MAYEFRLPDLGEGLTEGEVARWLVAEGQEVAEDDPLVEIQTDKTIVEIPSPAAGDGISTVVLSVWISTSGASSAISCPSDTSQRATSPSVRPSPRSGSLNSYAISEPFPQARGSGRRSRPGRTLSRR